MATHHGRPGGRGRELLLLLLTVLASILLIGGGFLFPLILTQATETGSSFFASKAGAALGFLGSALLWRKLLTYYRYDGHTLRPLKEEKTATSDNGSETNEG